MRFPLIPAFLFSLLIALCLAAGTWMTEGSLLKAYRGILESRFAIALDRAAAGATHAAALGVGLDSQEETLGAALRRELDLDPGILGMAVEDARGRRLYGAGAVAEPAPPGTLRQTLLDDLGLPIGRILLRYDPRALASPAAEIRHGMRGHAAPIVTGAALLGLLAALMLHAGRAGAGRGARLRLPVALALILGGGLFLIDQQALRIIDRTHDPLIESKVESVGTGARTLIDKALDLGIPLGQLQGVPDYFESLRRRYPELERIELDTAPAVPGAAAPGSLLLPVPARGPAAATLVVTPDTRQAAAQIHGLLLDTAFLGLVALLIGFELLALLTQTGAFRRAGAAADAGAGPPPAARQIRGVLFVFMMAEELNRPFLPSLTERLLPAGAGYAPLLVSLPIVVFMAIVALGQIPMAIWSESLGRRRGLMLGAAIAGAGYALCAWADSYAGLLMARALSAVGFTLVFTSAQGHIVDQRDPQARAAGLSVFISAILTAALCAPPIGGFLAEHFGGGTAFLGAAGLCLAALGLARAMMPAARPHARPPAAQRPAGGAIGEVWRIPGLRSLLLGCAVPAKLLLTALCFFLVPLVLAGEGHSLSSIGRVQMIYPLMMVLFVPLFSRWGEAPGRDVRAGKIVLGGLIAGLGVLPVVAWPGLGAIMAFLVLLGLGQALSITPQSSLMAMYAHRGQGRHSARVLGLFRLVERGGSAAGPALAGTLLGLLGPAPTLALFGLLTTGGALLYGYGQWRPASDASGSLS
ncbi:MFS transporter [Castellaniella defragrans]|uniref:MFS transporter n=1 Tax=Castellaniella defragrans TaxID=75697 RepID=UPI002AFE52A0|nr:MFS transporter [Castellaniella defragrans]